MEMCSLQADAAGRLNVSRSVVQRLSDQFRSRRFSFEKTCPRSAMCYHFCIRSVSNTFGPEKEPKLISDHFAAAGTRISSTTLRRCLYNQGLYARRKLVRVPS
ncbi:hypothetical protein AVEN_223642-1 [Araneus ventricosus]|uniref:Transposase Tc1-like domain-containing protein n=1 Tax=Araneus ventricosus TaxID=182803 RepID=A0A4Y2JUA9_ARAVE|nr:hypothetical protein AVEN_223642-1 [Araneus ventricosus]